MQRERREREVPGRVEALDLDLDWELLEDTPGIAKWRVRPRRDDEPTFIVSILGATVAKMAGLHRRDLTSDDLREGVKRAIARERDYGNAKRQREEGEEVPEVIEVMVRDSDLAELDGKVVGPTNNTPS